MEQMRKYQVSLLMGLVMLTLSAGTVSAADTAGATAESQQKPAMNTTKTKTVDARQVEAAAESVGRAVPHPLLHWDSVEKRPHEIKESDKPLVIVHNAVPIIITAADIDAQNKEAQHQKKGSAVIPIQPSVPARTLPPERQPAPIAPPVVKPAPVQQALPAAQTVADRNAVELPPIQPVAQQTAGPTVSRPAEKTVELPPIKPVTAARIKAAPVQSADTVELPPIQPVAGKIR